MQPNSVTSIGTVAGFEAELGLNGAFIEHLAERVPDNGDALLHLRRLAVGGGPREPGLVTRPIDARQIAPSVTSWPPSPPTTPGVGDPYPSRDPAREHCRPAHSGRFAAGHVEPHRPMINAGVPRSPREAAPNITPASAVSRSSAYCVRSQSSRVTRCMVPRAAALRLVPARGINEAA